MSGIITAAMGSYYTRRKDMNIKMDTRINKRYHESDKSFIKRVETTLWLTARESSPGLLQKDITKSNKPKVIYYDRTDNPISLLVLESILYPTGKVDRCLTI